MRYVLGQVAIFIAVTVFYLMIKPYLTFPVPDGKYWPGYGALLVTPLILTWRDKKLFLCLLSIASIWGISRYIDLVDRHYLAHVPFLYLNLALICVVLKQRVLGYLALATAGYCVVLIILHWNLAPVLMKLEILVYNLMFFAMLIYSVLHKGGNGNESEIEDNSIAVTRYKEAA